MSVELKYLINKPVCQKCEYWKTSEATDDKGNLYLRSGIFGKGNGSNGLMIIGENVNAECVIKGSNFQGSGGQLLNNLLLKSGINPADCYFTTLVRCKLPGNKKPKIKDIQVCQGFHQSTDLPSNNWRPKLVVLLGNTVLQTFTKQQKINDRRGQFFKIDFLDEQYPSIAVFNPSVVFYKPELVSTLELDFRRISEYLQGIRYEELPQHNRVFAYTELEFINKIKEFYNLPEDVVFTIDIETSGLDRQKNDIISMSITYKDVNKNSYESLIFLTIKREQDGECNFVDINDQNSYQRKLLKEFLEKRNCIFHNGDFDVRFIWRYGINVNYYGDTIDQHLLLEETEVHKLKFLVKKFVAAGSGYEKKIQDETENDPGMYVNAPKEILLTYNSDDTFFTNILYNKFTDRLREEKLHDFYINHAMPLRKTLTQISHRGILVDRDKIYDLSIRYRNLILQNRAQLYSLVGEEFNEGSTQQLSDIIYNKLKLPILNRTEKGAPSTDKETLLGLSEQSQAVGFVIEIRHLKKMLSTYLDGKTGTTINEGNGIIPYIDNNNRLHCDYLTHGTNSGRISARNINIQNFPKDSDIRNMVIAPVGWKLIEIDYKTAELVILAYLSGDKNFIKAVNERDLHSDVARLLLGVAPNEPVDDIVRTLAKRINFRKAYRGGPKGLAEEMKIPLQEAYDWYNKWDSSFPDIIKWFNEQDTLWRRQRYVKSIFGRKRRFPDFNYLLSVSRDDFNARQAFYDRIAVNFPCQSAVGDATNRAIYLFEQAMESIYGPWKPDLSMYNRPGVILTVHDSIVVECPDELVDDTVEILSLCAKKPLPTLNISLDIDVKISQCWMQKKLEEKDISDRLYDLEN